MSITIYPSQFNMRENGTYTQLPAIKGETGTQGVPGVGALPGGTAGQVPVKQSGTDYDVAWEDIGWKLLWTNANPTSTFVEQTVVLDLTEYSYIRVIFYATKDSAASSTGSVLYCFEYPKTGDSSQYYRINALHNTASGNAPAWIARDLKGFDTGVFVSTGGLKRTNATTAMSDNNDVLIPFIIYAR